MTETAKQILETIIGCEISTYEYTYGPDEAVVTISNLLTLHKGMTKYRVRKALKEIMTEGLICYKSQGCPAIVSYGECPELICDARPPINGYALTEKGCKSNEYKEAYAKWCKSLEVWVNGVYDKAEGE